MAAHTHTEFVCHISNYSDDAKVVVVENDQSFTTSSQQLSFGCHVDVTDSSLATCTVKVATYQHSRKLQYKLCVVYTSSVPHTTALHCSANISV